MKSSRTLCPIKGFDYFCVYKSYLTAKYCKSPKIARFLTRYSYFSNTPLNVYFSNGYIKPLKI